MSKEEVIGLLLSSAVISGIVTTALSYFFDILKNKDTRNFQLRQEAYTKVISSISGISDTVFNYFNKKHLLENRINPMIIVEFVAAHNKNMAPAMLVGSNEIKNYLKKMPGLIIDGANAVEEANKSAEKKGDIFTVDPSSKGAKVLIVWKDEIEELEEKIIELMRHDLNIKK